MQLTTRTNPHCYAIGTSVKVNREEEVEERTVKPGTVSRRSRDKLWCGDLPMH